MTQTTAADLGHDLQVSVMRLARRLRAVREDHGLTLTQLAALATLVRHGSLTPGRLATLEQVRPPSMTRTLAALEAEGLVTRAPDPDDGRCVLVRPTARARALLAADRRRRHAWLADQLAGLPAADRAVLADAVVVLDRLAGPGMSPTFAALSIRNYRWYFGGQIMSSSGTWMQRVAQDWLVLELTAGSATALGLTTALQFLPFLLFAPFGGVVADRFPHRRVLAVANVAAIVTSVLLGLAVIAGAATITLVYVLAFASGIAAALDNPARQAMAGELVGREHLANAVALNSAAFNVARLIGPAVAGVLVAAVGTGWVFLVNAATYGVFLVALAVIRPAELDRTQRGGEAGATLRDGIRYAREHRDLLFVLAVSFVVATFGLNFQMTNALMAREVFDLDAAAYGVMGTVLAVGSLTGALLAARRRTVSLRLLAGAGVAFGVVEALTAWAPTYLTYLLMLPACGVLALTFVTAAQSLVQLRSAPRVRGRMLGLYTVVFFGGTPAGAPVIGWAAQAFGPRWGLFGGGVLTALGVLAASAVLLRRRVARPDDHRPEVRAASAERWCAEGGATDQDRVGVAT